MQTYDTAYTRYLSNKKQESVSRIAHVGLVSHYYMANPDNRRNLTYHNSELGIVDYVKYQPFKWASKKSIVTTIKAEREQLAPSRRSSKKIVQTIDGVKYTLITPKRYQIA